jgi:plastocyanin
LTRSSFPAKVATNLAFEHEPVVAAQAASQPCRGERTILSNEEDFTMKTTAAKFCLVTGVLTLDVAMLAFAQGKPEYDHRSHEDPPRVAQVVALDECDPTTFNAALGPDFCKNIALGYSTTLSDLFADAAAGTPNPNWDFEPDTLKIKEGTVVSVVDQGGEPHTFTEVAKFGGGFIPQLNAGEETIPECAGGFSRVAVAKTRLLQGSQVQITGLSKGTHHFECCIHPWMRMNVEVK